MVFPTLLVLSKRWLANKADKGVFKNTMPKVLLDKVGVDPRIKNDYLNDRILRAYAKKRNLSFFGCIALFGDDKLYEVYREKVGGFFLLIDFKRKVTAMHPDGLKEFRYRTGAQCLLCKAVVYSSHKRHLQKCRCGSLQIDGGQEMLRISCDGPDDNYRIVTIDMLSRRTL